MTSAGDGWFEVIADCGAGTRYRYLLQDGQAAPEPASRLQDHDVHGHSIVVDPACLRHADECAARAKIDTTSSARFSLIQCRLVAS
jgi:1,4-alpha-glucan branching enzyme